MTLLAELREALGEPHVLTEGDLSAWELDWRRRWRGRALEQVAVLSLSGRDCRLHLPDGVRIRSAPDGVGIGDGSGPDVEFPTQAGERYVLTFEPAQRGSSGR